MRSAFGADWSANLTRDLFMSEHFLVNLSSRNMLHPLTELSNVNREKNKLKSFPLTVYISNNLASPVYQDKKTVTR